MAQLRIICVCLNKSITRSITVAVMVIVITDEVIVTMVQIEIATENSLGASIF